MKQTALVLGATGLVGSELVKLLLADDTFGKVIVLIRGRFDLQHPKLVISRVAFDNKEDFEKKIGNGDSIFCCVGTTLKKMKGDKIAYRKVDYDIAANAARFGIAAGYKRYLLVSSVGANATSGNFYLKLKGEVEDVIAGYPFESIHIFQPSILLGKRHEFRFGELIGKGVMQTISFLFFNGLQKYKAITAFEVAKAMASASKLKQRGIKVYQFADIVNPGRD